jgi:hypothetical protein
MTSGPEPSLTTWSTAAKDIWRGWSELDEPEPAEQEGTHLRALTAVDGHEPAPPTWAVTPDGVVEPLNGVRANGSSGSARVESGLVTAAASPPPVGGPWIVETFPGLEPSSFPAGRALLRGPAPVEPAPNPPVALQPPEPATPAEVAAPTRTTASAARPRRAHAATENVERWSKVRSALVLLVVVVSLGALLATVVAVIVGAVVIALQNALG